MFMDAGRAQELAEKMSKTKSHEVYKLKCDKTIIRTHLSYGAL